jgi:transposase InsO family protein
VYLINAVDEVTQFQCVCAVERISEAYLVPVLEAMMDAFPFVIRGFHSDNGSEYINHQVAKLLEKLRIEQTKSRSRQSNENEVSVEANLQVMPELQRAGGGQERVNRAQVPGLQPYPATLRQSGEHLRDCGAVALSELPSPLPLSDRSHRQERADTQALPLWGHDDPVREIPFTARGGNLSQKGCHHANAGCNRRRMQR